MKINLGSLNLREVLGAPVRLLVSLFLPMIALATEIQSTSVFTVLASVNVLGIVLGVTMFKLRNE